MSIVLFYSTRSKLCNDFIDIAHQKQIEMDMVRVDNPQAKQMLRTGKYFNINMVPAVMITTKDGDIEVYQGNNALYWIQNVQSNVIDEEPEIEELNTETSDGYIPPSPISVSTDKMTNSDLLKLKQEQINEERRRMDEAMFPMGGYKVPPGEN